jgi:hypothetical protein
MFDNKIFKEEVTRDHMSDFEELICFLLSSRFNGYVRMKSLTDKIENRKNTRL